MNVDYVNFYNNFLKLCNQKGLKATRAGIEAGVPKQTVSNWKTGTKPSDTYIMKLSEYFGVPIDYFLEKEKAPVSNKKTETLMKLIEMLTPENQDRLIDSISEMLKEQ